MDLSDATLEDTLHASPAKLYIITDFIRTRNSVPSAGKLLS